MKKLLVGVLALAVVGIAAIVGLTLYQKSQVDKLIQEGLVEVENRIQVLDAWAQKNSGRIEDTPDATKPKLRKRSTLIITESDLAQFPDLFDQQSDEDLKTDAFDLLTSFEVDWYRQAAFGELEFGITSKRVGEWKELILSDSVVLIRANEYVEPKLLSDKTQEGEWQYESGWVDYSLIALSGEPLQVDWVTSGRVAGDEDISFNFTRSDEAFMVKNEIANDLWSKVKTDVEGKLEGLISD